MHIYIDNLNIMLTLERDAAKAMVAGKGRTEKISLDGHDYFVDMGIVTTRAYADRIAKTQKQVESVNQLVDWLRESPPPMPRAPVAPPMSDGEASEAFNVCQCPPDPGDRTGMPICSI